MPRTQQHQRAVPYAEAAAVLRRFWDTDADLATKLSFEFLVLTATRSSETRLAAWDEIDWRNRVWTIPAKRMKGRLGDRQEHRVPLSGRALEVLEQAKALGNGSDLIFPSPLNGRAISDATHRVRLESLGVDAVPHGFRSSFRDWAAEQTNAPHAVMEAALAHRVKGQAEAAYARSDLLEKRRILMDEWADYLGGAKDARPV
jgi:integrase